MIRKIWKLIPAVLVCGVFGLASAQTAAPAAAGAAKAEEAKKKAADAGKADAAKKGADAQATAEDRAVANYRKNKGSGGMATKK